MFSSSILQNAALLLLAVSSSYAAPAPVELEPRATTRFVFSFGDSYSQTGFDPNGNKPSSSNPFGNPSYPGWTTSGGANWVGRLVHDLAPAGTLSWNFAYGGATVDRNIVAPFQSSVKCLVDQVNQFTSTAGTHPSYANWNSGNSVFIVWLGVNDVGNSWGWGGDQAGLHNRILDRYFQLVQTMYNSGGRNFVFLTVPPTNRSPNFLAQSTSNQNALKTQIQDFNNKIWSRVSSFASSHSGVKAQVYDTQNPFNNILNNPGGYGAANNYCYNSNGYSCLWWNDYHPGLAIQKAVGDGVSSTLKGMGWM